MSTSERTSYDILLLYYWDCSNPGRHRIRKKSYLKISTFLSQVLAKEVRQDFNSN